MRADILASLNAERAARRAAILVTDIADGSQRLVREAEIAGDPLGPVLGKHLASAKSGLVEADGRTLFLTVQVPPVRLVVIGAVHISQAMAPMAAALDLALTVIDPRTAFATPERFPGVELVAEWPETVLGNRVPPLDRYCALAALTHDPKIDDPALKAALTAECFYVGALGSRKREGMRNMPGECHGGPALGKAPGSRPPPALFPATRHGRHAAARLAPGNRRR